MPSRSLSPAAGGSSADPLASYFYAIKSKATKRQYIFKLRKYFDFLAIEGADLQDQAVNFVAQDGKIIIGLKDASPLCS